MEPDVPQVNRWEGIKQYSAGYGVVVVLTAVFIYFARETEAPNAGYLFGQIVGGAGVILIVPFLFAWLGKTDTPKRRFVLFLGLWIVIIGLAAIGRYVV